MAKVCSICNTENRDDAQFCRGCGTPLASTVVAVPPIAPAPAPAPAPTASSAAPATDVAATGYGVTCEECGFFNKAGIRFCAQCGSDLFGPQNKTVLAPPMQPGAAAKAPPATAASRDIAGAEETFDIDREAVPDIPDADATIAVTQQRPAVSQTPAANSHIAPPSVRNRTPLWIGVGVAVVAAAGAAWWFLMGSVSNTPVPYADPAASAASAVVFVPPVTASAPASSPFATLTDTGAASAAMSSASAVDANAMGSASVVPSVPAGAASMVAPSLPTSAPSSATVPASAPSMSNAPVVAVPVPPTSPFAALSQGSGAPAASTPVVDPVAKAAADKRARERIALQKADREAKAKALAEQRDQAAARQKAEQELTKRRAEEAMRLRNGGAATTPVPLPVVPPPPPQPKTVRDLCSGKGFIGQSLCEARECAAAGHANETVCRQLKETQERRQNYNN